MSKLESKSPKGINVLYVGLIQWFVFLIVLVSTHLEYQVPTEKNIDITFEDSIELMEANLSDQICTANECLLVP